jgi:hypothetical protein
MSTPTKSLGNGRILAGDATLAFLLLNELRHRIVVRVFGVSTRDSNIVSVFAIGSLFAALAAAAARVRRVRVRPTGEETAIGAVVLKETAHGIAGTWSRTTPLFTALIVLVVLEKSFGPTLRGSLRLVRDSVRGVNGSLRRAMDLLQGRES